MEYIKKQSFGKGVLILLCSQIIIKLLGFVYRVVITGMEGFGDVGNSYYGAAYQIYTVLLAISTVGIPSALAKLVAEKAAVNDIKGAHRIFKTALGLFAIIGLLGSTIMLVFGEALANLISNPGVKYSLWSLSPSIFFIAIASVIRGYFQGFCDMKPQANSQIIDQIGKCFFTILLAYMFLGKSPEIMAAAATFGATIGTIMSVIYVVYYYQRRKKDIWEGAKNGRKASVETRKRIIRNILTLSIPITFGAIITSISGMVNVLTVMPRLLDAGFSTLQAQEWYGILVGKSDVLLNLPLALNVVYATSLVPNVASALAVKDEKTAAKKIEFSIFSTIVITLPAAIGLSVLSDEILKLIFPSAPNGGYIIQVSAFSVVFIALTQTLSGALQGMGRVYTPAIALLTGAIVKYIMNYILVAIPEINIMGATYSAIACYLISFTISFTILRKNIKLNIPVSKYLIKPVIASAIMGFVAYYSHSIVFNMANSRLIAMIIAVGLAMITYAGMLILMKTFDKEDMNKIPVVGKYIAKIL